MAETFDPNGVGIANGNIFGFPVEEAEADILLIPVPWDATASYGKERVMVRKQFWTLPHSWIFTITNYRKLGKPKFS